LFSKNDSKRTALEHLFWVVRQGTPPLEAELVNRTRNGSNTLQRIRLIN